MIEKNKKPYQAIVFDVDSTLVQIEGLDWLASQKSLGEEMERLTRLSMEGEISFNEAMIAKMNAIAPSFGDLEKLGEAYCNNLSPGVEEVVQALKVLDKEVWILTGNFNPAVGILARHLGIKKKHVICNKVFHSEGGEYTGFDSKGPLSNNGGKAEAIKKVTKNSSVRTVYIGDSVTDLEARDEVDLFVGYGGAVVREKVKKEADIYLGGRDFCELLSFILTKEEQERLSRKEWKN